MLKSFSAMHIPIVVPVQQKVFMTAVQEAISIIPSPGEMIMLLQQRFSIKQQEKAGISRSLIIPGRAVQVDIISGPGFPGIM